MRKIRTAIAATALLLAATIPEIPSERSTPVATRPVDVFADLDGKWGGAFVGYDASGKELYRIAVEQEYETVDDNTQRVRVRDTMSDGKVITAEGENTARRTKDGSLELECVVRKSNGETVRHTGRIVKGPRGEKQLVWYSNEKSRSETFREWVEGEKADAVYHIHGMGNYGGTAMLMVGRYARR